MTNTEYSHVAKTRMFKACLRSPDMSTKAAMLRLQKLARGAGKDCEHEEGMDEMLCVDVARDIAKGIELWVDDWLWAIVVRSYLVENKPDCSFSMAQDLMITDLADVVADGMWSK